MIGVFILEEIASAQPAPMQTQSRKDVLMWLSLSMLIIVLDQLTKWWVSHALELYQAVSVTSFFNIILAHNMGAAFSFLADAGGWQRWLFTGVSISVSAVLVYWLFTLPKKDKMLAFALSMVIGGAVGNLIDRIVYGYVVDFLDFYWKNSHFPAFNIADSAITLGAMILGYHILFDKTPSD